MNDTQEFLLLNVLLDVGEYQNVAYASFAKDGRGKGLQTKHERAIDGWASYRPADWIDQPTAKERKDLAAALRDLEAAGLAEADRDATNRPNWVRLTATGEAAARKIAAKVGVDVSSPKKTKTPLDRLRWFAGCMERCIENNRQRMTAPLFLNNPQGQETLRDCITQAEAKLAKAEEAIRRVEAGEEDGNAAIKRVM